MKASDLRPLLVIDKSDIDIQRLNDLLELINRLEQKVERLEQRSGRCECMNCIVIGA